MATHAPDIADKSEHVLGADGEFHVTDEPVDLSLYHFEDWIAFAFFWVLAATVFYQFFTRYALMGKIGKQQMSIIDWPILLIYAGVLFGFALMCFRAVTTAAKHWRQGFSVLERPEVSGSEEA